MHRADSQDNMLVKSYILLPLILSAFEHDASVMSLELRTPAPYLEVISLLFTRRRRLTCRRFVPGCGPAG